jgi:hypothetical protein
VVRFQVEYPALTPEKKQKLTELFGHGMLQ